MSLFRRLNPSLLHSFRHFERCLDNVSRTKEQNFFLEKSIREQVIPKTFDVLINSKDNQAFIRARPCQPRFSTTGRCPTQTTLHLPTSCRDTVTRHSYEISKRRLRGRSHAALGGTLWHSTANCIGSVITQFGRSFLSRKTYILGLGFRELSKDEFILLGLGIGFTLEANRSDMMVSVYSFGYFKEKK